VIDRNLLLRSYDETARRLGRKGVDASLLQEVRSLVEERKGLVTSESGLRGDLKNASKKIGGLMREGRREEAQAAKASVAQIKATLAGNHERLVALEERLHIVMLEIPNIPSDAAPDGSTDRDNVLLKTVGYDPAAFEGRSFKPHWEIADELGLMDNPRGAKMSGNMWPVLAGDGARLLRALVAYGLDLHRETYEEVIVPTFVRGETFTKTGHLPKFAPDAYKIEGLDLWAIPTGEVPLMAMHQDELMEAADLPRRYMTHTSCFRRESGSAGKETRGLQRVHEFHKVELVRLCTEEAVDAEFAGLLADAERTLSTLGLPYRVLDLCCGDLPNSSERVFDLEVYSPGTDRWMEVSSVGRFGNYQTRRGHTRYRPEGGGKPRFAQAMNGSGLATPRVWAALLEYGLQEDGRVALPEALVPYFGKPFVERNPFR
jgi:seryl-tRNA synthetase